MALVHDRLCDIGGSERIFQYFCEEFPEADVYTLAFNPERTLPYFSDCEVHTTWLNPLVRSTRAFHWSFLPATYAMERLDLTRYDVVLSSSATVAKYVRAPNGLHICYCYVPTRALWQFEEYFGRGLKSKLLKTALPFLRKRDYAAAQRIDKFIGISKASRDYIRDFYHRDADVLHCPIDTDAFHPQGTRKNHYLMVSRLEHWKRLDYAIEAFNELGLPLRIVGRGGAATRLRAMAKDNITFVGAVDDVTLAREYSEARALIFTPFLEYGLVPLEANACGTPVICYGKGGITEIMVPVDAASADAPSTAVFFYEQTSTSLIAAVNRFERGHLFRSEDLVNHAARWNIPSFKKKLRKIVTSFATDLCLPITGADPR